MLEKSNCESGVTPLMKERLKEEAKHLKDEAQLCSLVIDEMAISSKYIYDRKMGCFFGQETAKEETSKGGDATNVVLANKVLCFVVTGLSTSYTIPCGFFFTNRLSGKLLHRLTVQVRTEVEKCGLKVVRIVTDNHKNQRDNDAPPGKRLFEANRTTSMLSKKKAVPGV